MHWVLILPDGSRSLIPADWTDHGPSARQVVDQTAPASLAGLEELLRLRTIVDALLRRAPVSPRDIAQPATPDA